MNTYQRIASMVLLLFMLVAALPAGALAQTDKPDPLRDVSFEQRLDAQVPLDLPFVDSDGNNVRLGDYFGEKPVVLTMGYYECPMLCSLVRQGMLDTLEKVKLDVGTDFTVVNVSIDPTETPMVAAAQKSLFVAKYNRPGSEAGWNFLTGPQDSIDRLAAAVGFKYVYDPAIDQYSHAAGIMVATPKGRLARYFYGIEFSPTDIRLGLVESSANKIGTPTDQLLLLCYSYNPMTGKYTGLIMTLTRLMSVLTMVGIGGLLMMLSRRKGTDAMQTAS